MHILTSALKWFKETRRVGLGAHSLAIHMSVCVWWLIVHQSTFSEAAFSDVHKCPICVNYQLLYVGKIDHLRASTEIHFLPVQERYIHALSRNTNCLTMDGQVCFYRRLFTDAVKPQGCISWSWGALIGLHGVPNCSSRQSWPPLWIVSIHVTHPPPTRPPPIDSIRDITRARKNYQKNKQHSSS